MIKNTLQYCATDKEIHDALMSAKQKIGEKVLLELAKDRGIFYSAKDTRGPGEQAQGGFVSAG
jgi:hypothetical protein